MMTIFSTDTCPRCQALKSALTKAGITYEEKLLDPAAISDCLCDTGILAKSAPLVKDGYVWFFADDFFDGNELKRDWLVTLKGIRLHKEFSGEGGKGSDIDASKCSKIWGE